jgi:guanine deaminase
MCSHAHYMQIAIDLAKTNMVTNEGGPFGAVVVKDGTIVGRGNNRVTSTNDPTAHAEVVAIRDACANLGTFQLDGCVLYTSCEPCPMCLGAIYWARPDAMYYGCTRHDAADIHFDDAFIYEEIQVGIDQRKIPTTQICREEALEAFVLWQQKVDKLTY